MLRMQEGEVHSRLCLDRLPLEAIHKVRSLPLIFTLHSHFSPNSGLVVHEMGDEKATRPWLVWLSELSAGLRTEG